MFPHVLTQGRKAEHELTSLNRGLSHTMPELAKGKHMIPVPRRIAALEVSPANDLILHVPEKTWEVGVDGLGGHHGSEVVGT